MPRARVLACIASLISLLTTALAGAQPVLSRPEARPGGVLLVVTDKSGLVNNDSPLYLASNHAGWNPGEQANRLSGRSDLRWQILLPGPIGEPPLEFKFTRGSWETCEVAADLSDIANRTLAPIDVAGLAPDQPVVIELTIERFADERGGAATPQPHADTTLALRVTGRAVRVQVVGGAGTAVGAVRDVIVWLPPGYDDPANAERRYPVLYMQDGQNVFDFQPPTPGEWQADETATRLIEAGKLQPIIIAAVPHSGANRLVEYLPADALGVQGRGDAYLDWLVREVVPRVERSVRADPDPDARGVGGSSLGGLIALRAGQRYPETFGRLLAESPSLAVRGEDLGTVLFDKLDAWRPRTWIAVGTAEAGTGTDRGESSRAYANAVVHLAATLNQLAGDGRVGSQLDGGAQHNEHAWADRFDDALLHLYGVDPQ